MKIKKMPVLRLSTIPTDILESKEINAAAKIVFAFFFTTFNTQKSLKIGYSKIASSVGLSVGAVRKAVALLTKMELIKLVPNRDNFDNTNVYELGD